MYCDLEYVPDPDFAAPGNTSWSLFPDVTKTSPGDLNHVVFTACTPSEQF